MTIKVALGATLEKLQAEFSRQSLAVAELQRRFSELQEVDTSDPAVLNAAAEIGRLIDELVGINPPIRPNLQELAAGIFHGCGSLVQSYQHQHQEEERKHQEEQARQLRAAAFASQEAAEETRRARLREGLPA